MKLTHGRLAVVLTLAIGALLYGPHWHIWWLAAVDKAGELQGRPWPAGFDDLTALSYVTRPDVLAAQVGLLLLSLLAAAAIAAFATQYLPGVHIRRRPH